MVQRFAKIPRYILKDGSHPTRPIVLSETSRAESTVIFAFSGKPAYDAFLIASSQALTPYPLVKGYLQNQLALGVDGLRLIVLDAGGPQQEALDAATFENVLESFERNSESVPITHQLFRDEASRGYRIQTLADAVPEKLV